MEPTEPALEANHDSFEAPKTAGAGQGAENEDGGENGDVSSSTFDPKKRPRHWARRAVPIQLIGGEEIHIMKWVTDTARKVLRKFVKFLFLTSRGKLSSKEESFTSAEAQEALKRKAALAQGRKLFTCSWPNCAKSFFESSRLKRHMLVHTGRNNTTCALADMCGPDEQVSDHSSVPSKDVASRFPWTSTSGRIRHLLAAPAPTFTSEPLHSLPPLIRYVSSF
eukprot:760255-Hanusia_phi.AAC.3